MIKQFTKDVAQDFLHMLTVKEPYKKSSTVLTRKAFHSRPLRLIHTFRTYSFRSSPPVQIQTFEMYSSHNIDAKNKVYTFLVSLNFVQFGRSYRPSFNIPTLRYLLRRYWERGRKFQSGKLRCETDSLLAAQGHVHWQMSNANFKRPRNVTSAVCSL
jgi:hypothetical protein